jgi:hypothetical protein
MTNESSMRKQFKEYRRKIKNAWEEYLLLHFSLSELKRAHKEKSIVDRFKRELLIENVKYNYKDFDIHHFLEDLTKNKLNYKALIEAVSLTETFLQDLTILVYRDFPQKITHNNPDSPASEIKLIHLIVNSTDKNEMVDALIEEKVRGIFYGKPTDFFVKDKAKIGFGDYFSNNFQKAIIEFNEITARRNIFIHNNGKVDSKYLREVEGSLYKKGTIPIIDLAYVKNAFIVLRGLTALATKLVIQNTYKNDTTRMRETSMANTLNKYLK